MIKLSTILNEIEIRQTRTWNFTKYIPNFDADKIKVGDTLIVFDRDSGYFKSKVSRIVGNTIFHEKGWASKGYLIEINSENQKLNEIQIKSKIENGINEIEIKPGKTPNQVLDLWLDLFSGAREDKRFEALNILAKYGRKSAEAGRLSLFDWLKTLPVNKLNLLHRDMEQLFK